MQLLSLAAALLWSTVAFATDDTLVAHTTAGMVRGSREQGVQVFRGIPYAAPPTGERRWRPPAPAPAWQGVRDALRFGPDCPGAFPDRGTMSEDCLYLNVWTGSVDAGAKKPVMLWIYGGGFRGGSASSPLIDGGALARGGAVLVTFGYRTGPLGFLALPELKAESANGSSGNYGILDAISALRWIRANIANFGGDPGNVTVFGQSSGSETVNILTASPLAKGLFQRAIGESGSSLGVRAAPPQAEAEQEGANFLSRLGAANLAELRAMRWEDLAQLDTEKFEPNVDGWLLPRSVSAIYRSGAQNDVPMLVGNTAQEFDRPEEITPEAFELQLAERYGALANSIGSRLDNADPADASWRLTNAEWGDYPAAAWTRLQADSGTAPIYRYLFDYAPPSSDGRPRIARHGSEIAYIFGTYARRSEEDERLGQLLISYWINFARTGDPNGTDLPEWRPESEAPATYMRFSGTGAAQEPARDQGLIEALAFHYAEQEDEKQ